MKIILHNIEVWTHIGTTTMERSAEQQLIVCVSAQCNDERSCITDNLSDTTDYANIIKGIQRLGKKERNTIEKFAKDAADFVLGITGADEVKVRANKFALPGVGKITLEYHAEKSS